MSDTPNPETDTSTQSWLGSLPEEVRASIPEEFSKDPNVVKYKDVGEFVKGHVNLSKKIGEKGVLLPKPGAAPEELNSFYNQLGRPETPDKYQFKNPDGMHKAVQSTPEFQKGFASFVHKHGLTQSQADGVYQEYLKMWSDGATKQEQSSIENTKKAETELRNRWGADYDKNVQIAKKIAGKNDKLTKKEWVNDPDFIEFVGDLGKNFSEDSISNVGKGTSELSPDEAMKQIRAMNEDKKGDLYSDDQNKRSAAIKRRGELYEKAYGSK